MLLCRLVLMLFLEFGWKLFLVFTLFKVHMGYLHLVHLAGDLLPAAIADGWGIQPHPVTECADHTALGRNGVVAVSLQISFSINGPAVHFGDQSTI